MKKIFCLTFLLAALCQPVFAKTVVVQALEDFSSENPPKNYSVVILQDLAFDEENILFKSGDVLDGEIIDVKNPKRLKRNATFTFVPLTCTNASGTKTDIKGYYPAKYTTKINKADVAKSAALSVGNYFVKGLSMGYNAIEGVVKNEQDNRLKSGAVSLYKSSPFSYVEKGQEIFIPKEQNFFLNFKIKENSPDNEDTPLDK